MVNNPIGYCSSIGCGYAGFGATSFAILTDILNASVKREDFALGTGLFYFMQCT
jgi:hypothetical protein